MPIPQETIHYTTYVKKALVQGVRQVFDNHVDEILERTKVDIEFPTDKASYPAIVIRFFERDITNLGVGHREWIPELDDNGDPTGNFIKYKHYYFTGDIEFAIYALSSVDRDLLGDSIVQTLTMGDLQTYTNYLFERIYNPNRTQSPESDDTMLNLNTDKLQGFGESQVQAPWLPEDVLVYQKSYRVGITGEFYSLTPGDEVYGVVQAADIYPYITDMEPVPSGIQDTPGWSDDFSTDRSAEYAFAPTDSLTDFIPSGGDLVVGTSSYLRIAPPITIEGDLQIDTHFVWDGSNDMELAYYWHFDTDFESPTNGQYAYLALGTTDSYKVYKARTRVDDRLPDPWVENVTSIVDTTGLANRDLWWRVKVEDFKITGELWLANPVSSLKTNRILRTAYALAPEERVIGGGAVWTEHRNVTIHDFTITTPNLTPWFGETTLIS